MVRGLFAFAACLGVLASASAPACAEEQKPNTLTPAEKKAGWKLLFDGKTTKGWRAFRGKDVPPAWKVEDGLLTFAGKKEGVEGGDILTVDQFESFELSLEWRISEGGNSGVIYHVQETEDRPWKTGPEMQVLDNKKHKDGASPLTSAGSCYALYPPPKDVTRPVGEWNEARLIIDNGHVEHWLNGEKLVSYEKGSEEWNAKVAASKFKDFPSFGKPTRGHIDLQDHQDPVAYRNIKIRVIKSKAAKK
jgi:hypothetical protein